ncbi:hypothetical protein BKA62DRAFT_352378 [Auriculariales sp. MPI-PUGE-AT-0066]|nr:hypothetical protein BKA62DRAFT_352378 [Auriculariales sp. MPI-PUGE-AT-0066]
MAESFPIDQLPTELLGKVFCHMLDNDLPHYDQRAYFVDESFGLARVSRAFRSVALSTPRLWAGVDFNCAKMEANGEIWIHYLKNVLERSKDAPLNVRLFQVTVDGGEMLARRKRLEVGTYERVPERPLSIWAVEAILEHKHRLRSLYVSMTNTTDELPRAFGTGALPLLESFTIKHHAVVRPLQDNLFIEAPRLHELRVDSQLFSRDHGRTRPFLQKLSQLELSNIAGIDIDVLFGILESCSSSDTLKVRGRLNELTISGGHAFVSHRETMTYRPDLVFPNLKTLRLNGPAIWHVVELVDYLNFPALRTASIMDINISQPLHRRFLQQCCLYVRNLTVQTPYASPNLPVTSSGFIADILAWCPDLVELTVSNYTLRMGDINALVSSARQLSAVSKTDEPDFIPGSNLTSLSLPFGAFQVDYRDAIVSGLLQFVELRQRAVERGMVAPPLRKVNLNHHLDREAEVLALTIQAMVSV